MGYGLLGASTCITWFYMTCQPLLIQKKNNLYPQKQAAYLPFICTRASQRCAGSHDSGFHTLHTVVSLPYYPIHLKEKIISKLIQKSKVVYLRCQKVGQYCKPYLKYWPQGVNDPLEPSGGQKIQWFIKWKGLLVSGGVYNRVQINSI